MKKKREIIYNTWGKRFMRLVMINGRAKSFTIVDKKESK